MKKGLEITAYLLGGLSLVVLANQIVKVKSSGKGFLTTSRKMSKKVGTSSFALNEPYTKDNVAEFYDFWDSLGKEYRTSWYKAVWESENGNETPFFYVGTKKFKTKGGRSA
jgi:aryl-phospho-beta-D-glucosidase BglC (GH1 family)